MQKIIFNNEEKEEIRQKFLDGTSINSISKDKAVSKIVVKKVLLTLNIDTNRKISFYRQNKTYEELYGKEKAESIKQKLRTNLSPIFKKEYESVVKKSEEVICLYNQGIPALSIGKKYRCSQEVIEKILKTMIAKEKKREYMKEYCQRPESKLKREKYIEEHKEEIKENSRKYREEHKEEKREYRKKNREENKEEIREKEKIYYEKNRDKISRRSKEHYQLPEVKKKRKEHNQSPGVKKKRKEYRQRPERIEYRKKYYENNFKNKSFCNDCAKEIKKTSLMCPSCANKGENNPGWRGGVQYEPYDKLFDNKFRRAIRKRDNQICMMCGIHKEKLNRALNVHHISGDKKMSIPQNCISLCPKCHSLVHNNKTENKKQEWIKFFQSLLNKNYDYKYSDKQEIIIIGGKKW